MDNFTKQKFTNGEVIFKEGDEGRYLCEIMEGKVDIFRNHGEKNEKLLTTLKAGDYFGEMGLIDDLPRSATAVAAGDCGLLLVYKEEFPEYLKLNPETSLQIMKVLSARLRELTGDFMEACGTIAETLKNEEKKKSKSLLGRLKKFADIYSESCLSIAEAERMGMPGQHMLFYNGYYRMY